ncbi:MAG: DUF4124 domain-containing protein [Pseudomonadales bacterium]
MNKRLYGLILLATLSFTNNAAYAEIYRWVDEQGKVHFGDKVNGNQQAKDISQDVKLKNLDHSAKRTEQSLQQIDLRQQAQTTETQQKQSQTSPKAEQQARQCQVVKERLRIMQGRVAFLDENGHHVKVTEKERQQRAVTLREQVNKLCR